MKYLVLICIVFLLTAGYVTRESNNISSIYGTIDPPDAAKKIYAIRGTDTVTVVPQSGKFSVAVTAGTWKLYVLATKPYKDVVIDNIYVDEGKSTDAGVVRLAAD